MSGEFDPFRAAENRLQMRLQTLNDLIINLQRRYDVETRINEQTLLKMDLDRANQTYKDVLGEYQDLKAQPQGSSSVALAGANTQLESMNEKLDTMLLQQQFLALAVGRLSQQQCDDTEAVLAAVQQKPLSDPELQQTLNDLQTVVSALAQSGKLQGTPLEQPALQAKAVFEDTKLDVKHKIKTTIPLIPFVLSYENEISLGSGANLQSVWDGMVNRFRRKEETANPR